MSVALFFIGLSVGVVLVLFAFVMTAWFFKDTINKFINGSAETSSSSP